MTAPTTTTTRHPLSTLEELSAYGTLLRAHLYNVKRTVETHAQTFRIGQDREVDNVYLATAEDETLYFCPLWECVAKDLATDGQRYRLSLELVDDDGQQRNASLPIAYSGELEADAARVCGVVVWFLSRRRAGTV